MSPGGVSSPAPSLFSHIGGPIMSLALLLLGPATLFVGIATPASAQTISGTTYEDRNANGVRDAGEPALAGVAVELLGTKDAGGTTNPTVTTPSNGAYTFSTGNGCYLLLPHDPAGWRFTGSRSDDFVKSSPGYTFPVGQPRFSKLDQGISNLKLGRMRFTAMGDSIAWNWNSCFFPSSFWYSTQVQARLQCVQASASVPLDEAAVKGEHTDDLLIDDGADLNNVFAVIRLSPQPQLVTISMIGNDLLGVDPGSSPTQADTNKMVAEILDSRQNLQEAISALISEIPGADVSLNTLYDNLAWNCYSSPTEPWHQQWLPIVDRILRELAWGQTRRASINEVAADYAHENQAGTCFGFDNQICRDIFNTDDIHPNNNGYKIHREKVWEAAGGVNLGPKDALSRTSIANADYGFLKRVRRLLPTTWEARNGAAVTTPQAAFSDQDSGQAAAISLGIGTEEFRVAGFPDWYDEDQIVRVVAGVRYRTTGAVADDFYRLEGSVTGTFRPAPGYNYNTTNWNFYTPIVGGGGPNQPPENSDFSDEKLLVVPNVASYREVSATLTKNPVLNGSGSDYLWPAVTHPEIATTAIRVVSAPVAATPGNDGYQVQLDAAWLDVYGWQKTRPAEVANLRVAKRADGTLDVSFDPLASAQRYNLYFGRLATVHGGTYDHGHSAPAGPLCAAPTQDAGGGRLEIVVAPAQQPAGISYILVTAHVDDVESPAGMRSDATEIDRSQSICY